METRYAGGGISWFALIVGIALGIGLGLFYTWEIDPVIQKNTVPKHLSAEAREDYVVAVALSYAYNRDIDLAFQRLVALDPDESVWEMVAEIACARHQRVRITDNTDVIVMRALEQLYRSQGASGCADGQYPTPAPILPNSPVPAITPTFTATVPTKTPTPPIPTDTPAPATPTLTPPPSGRFIVGSIEPFCDPQISGLIEVRVFDSAGLGMAGIPVEVMWAGNRRETFYTGLKPGREPGYADFEMTEGNSYLVTVPGLTSTPDLLEATTCEVNVDGRTEFALRSYRINFHQREG